jgi:hypothetical protein
MDDYTTMKSKHEDRRERNTKYKKTRVEDKIRSKYNHIEKSLMERKSQRHRVQNKYY